VGISRRKLVLGVGAATVGGLVAGAAEGTASELAESGPLPFYGGFASAIRPDLIAPTCAGGAVHWWGDRASRRIALTFDDGPHPRWTPALLEVLAAENVRATFFVKGVAVTANPRVHQGSVGHHEIGNHTWEHPDLGRLDHDAVVAQIRRCSEAVEDVLGVTPRVFRPPYGHLGGSTVLAASEAGLPMVLWSARARESRFVEHPDGVVADIVGQVSDGAIVLAHDAGQPSRLIALDRMQTIVRQLKDAGHELVTVSELLAGTTSSVA
jgi:peptidoglycan/xylan/chitin deacetylase (PgdA/CDA1 family)